MAAKEKNFGSGAIEDMITSLLNEAKSTEILEEKLMCYDRILKGIAIRNKIKDEAFGSGFSNTGDK